MKQQVNKRTDETFQVGNWIEFIRPRGSFHYNMGVIQRKITPYLSKASSSSDALDTYEILLYSGETVHAKLHEFRKMGKDEVKKIEEKMEKEDVLKVKDIQIGDWVQEKGCSSPFRGRIVGIEEKEIKIRLHNGMYIKKKIYSWERIYGVAKIDGAGIKEEAEDADFWIDRFYPGANAILEPIYFDSMREVEIAETLLPVLKNMRKFCNETVTSDSPWTSGHFVIRVNTGSDEEPWIKVLEKINKNSRYVYARWLKDEYKYIYKKDLFIRIALKEEFRGPGFK